MRVLAPAVLAALLMGCAPGPTADDRNPEGVAAANSVAAALQTGVEHDYEPFDTPEAQRDAADLVVVGTVTEVVPGRQLPYGRTAAHANLAVSVEEGISGFTRDAGTVYVEIEVGSADGVAPIRDAALGRRLLLFLDDRTDVAGVDGERGRPTGASIYTPFIEGVVIDAGDGWVGGLVDRSELGAGWRKYASFDSLVSGLKQ